jgi:di/tricarboxylate transporter
VPLHGTKRLHADGDYGLREGFRCVAPSHLMMPVAFAYLAASKLTLLGTPANVISTNAAEGAGLEPIRFFEWPLVGAPLLAGTVAIILVFGRFLLPERRSRSIPADFSAHASTLVEQYRIEDGLHRLRVSSTSPYVGQLRTAVGLKAYPSLSMISLLEGESGSPLQRPPIIEAISCSFAAMPMWWAVLRATSILPIRADDATTSGVAETLSIAPRVWPRL